MGCGRNLLGFVWVAIDWSAETVWVGGDDCSGDPRLIRFELRVEVSRGCGRKRLLGEVGDVDAICGVLLQAALVVARAIQKDAATSIGTCGWARRLCGV